MPGERRELLDRINRLHLIVRSRVGACSAGVDRVAAGMSGLAAKHQGAREGNEFAEGVAHHTIRATARGRRGGRFPPASLMRRNGARL
jgi:hypothetical protein